MRKVGSVEFEGDVFQLFESDGEFYTPLLSLLAAIGLDKSIAKRRMNQIVAMIAYRDAEGDMKLFRPKQFTTYSMPHADLKPINTDDLDDYQRILARVDGTVYLRIDGTNYYLSGMNVDHISPRVLPTFDIFALRFYRAAYVQCRRAPASIG